MSRKNAILILPDLKDRKGDLTKEWFVQFSYRVATDKKMVRKRISQDLNGVSINSFTTASERKQVAQPIIDYYTKKLKNGWTPEDEGLIVYEDQLTYSAVVKNYGRRKKSNRNIRMVASKFFDYKKGSIVEKSYNSYLSKLRLFTAFCETNKLGDVDITSITNEVVVKFIQFISQERKLDKITVKKYRQILFTFFKWAKETYNLHENPVYGIELPRKKVDNAARPIIETDLNKLLDAIEFDDPQLYMALMIQYYSAIRPGNEMQNLRIKDIDFFNNQAVINAVDAKRERRIATLPDQLVELLTDRFQLQQFNPDFYILGRSRVPGPDKVGANTLRNRFNQYRERLNLPTHYKYYSLKHTAAGKLLKDGKTISEIRDWCGHTTTSSTEHYVRRHFGIKNKAIEKNFPPPRS